LGFELGASHLKSGAVLLEPHLQSILLCIFWRWGLETPSYLPRVSSNCNSPDISLPSR
jgi:hypothetical protein